MSSPIGRIVVPTDFSPASEAAVAYAGELAVRLAATVHLVHVIDELLMPEIALGTVKVVADLHEWLYLDARAKLARAAEALEPLVVPTTSEVRVGLPMTEIVLAANKARADLIVMATHDSDASTEAPSERVAHYVIRHARCPVLQARRHGRVRSMWSGGEPVWPWLQPDREGVPPRPRLGGEERVAGQR